MFKFETSDQKSLKVRPVKVKPLKPTTKVVATPHPSSLLEADMITDISTYTRENINFQEHFFKEMDLRREGAVRSYFMKNVSFEIFFIDGYHFECRCDNGMLTLWVDEYGPYSSLKMLAGNYYCTGGSSASVELCKRLRNFVPIIGTLTTGIGENGVRCSFNNTDISIQFKDCVAYRSFSPKLGLHCSYPD